MKLTVKRTVIQEQFCEIEVPDFNSAKTEIEKLLPDDFGGSDEYTQLEIFNEAQAEVTGEIQPYCPRL